MTDQEFGICPECGKDVRQGDVPFVPPDPAQLNP